MAGTAERRKVEVAPARALRGFESSIAESVAAAVRTIKEGIDGPRRDIQGLLAGSAYCEALECIGHLRLCEQLKEEHARLEHFGFLQHGEQLPFSFDQLVRSMSPAQLEIARRHIPDPTLLVRPKVSFEAEVRAIDAHRNAGQIETYVNRDEFKSEEETAKNDGEMKAWSWRIIQGTREARPASWDDVSLILEKRMEDARKHRHPLARGTDRHDGAHLTMRNLKDGTPMNQRTWTVFDGDRACSPSHVLSGYWNDVQVYFNTRRADNPFEYARFLSSVGGDVSLS